MATNESSPLPQYYGQQLPDGTVIESPNAPRHLRGSSDSRQELLRIPVPPHQAHVEDLFEPPSPTPASGANGLGIGQVHSPNNKRIGGNAEPSDFGTPTGSRYRRRTHDQDFRRSVHRHAYPEEYPSDEEYERDGYREPYRRRQSRAYRGPPPSAYMNDPHRYRPMHERSSYDSHGGFVHDKPHYHMHYGSDDEHTPRRPNMNVTSGRHGPPDRPTTKEVMRLPWAMWMGSTAKNHFVAFVGEFVGTTMFLFFAFSGTQVANIGSNAGGDSNTTTGQATGFSPNVLLYIALVFAFSLMVNVWVFFRISGGLFNPAVTLAMLLCRALSPVRAMLLIAAQITGSIFSSYLVSVLFPTAFNVRTTLSTGTTLAQGVMIEAVLTFELVFTIFMLAKEKHKATFIAPVGIGLALFIAELVGVYYTGGSLNPARSFGPCVVTGIFDKEHWIYWVGPGVGSVIAVVFYQFIKILEYEVANPGQDDDDKDKEEKEKGKEQESNPDDNVGMGA